MVCYYSVLFVRRVICALLLAIVWSLCVVVAMSCWSLCVVVVRCLMVVYCLSFDGDVLSLLFVGLPMVGVWCIWRVLLCLMAVRAAIVCYMSCVAVGVLGRNLLRFAVVGVCCI